MGIGFVDRQLFGSDLYCVYKLRRFSSIKRIASLPLLLGSFTSSFSIRSGLIFALSQSKWLLTPPEAVRY